MQVLAMNLVRRVSRSQAICRNAYSTQRVRDIGQPTPASHPHLMAEGEVTPGIRIEEYIGRRKKLLELLPDNSLAIISSAPVKKMTDVVPYTFRQEADYLYLTGCQQPGGVAVLSDERGLCMFMPEQTPNDIAWEGEVAGVDAASEVFKAEQAYPISKLPEILSDMIRNSSKVFHNVHTASQRYTNLVEFQKSVSLDKVKTLSSLTHELRLIKSPAELKLMRESASIACQSLLKTMLHSKRFPDEGILSAQVEYECRVRGAQRMAFNPVVGGGPNASVIHYSRNDQQIKDGDLVLMDMGCELHGYVSDLTRTWPPCGKFSSLQKEFCGSLLDFTVMCREQAGNRLFCNSLKEELYDLILQTNKECIKLCKPGITIRQLNTYSTDLLCEGLMKMGILKSRRLYQQLNPTSIGHYLGMDVHDSSAVGYDRPLQPGFVITIEPGVYIPSSFNCPERFQGIGIRIEDDVLITETGYEVLTGSMPKEIKHIETLLNNHCHQNSVQSFASLSS